MENPQLASKVFFNKILNSSKNPESEESSSFFILKSKWEEAEIEFEFVDLLQHKCYLGSIKKEELTKLATDLSIPVEKFSQECMEALTTSGGINNFEYSLISETERFVLTKKDRFNIEYLNLELKMNEIQNLCDIIASATDKIVELQKQCEETKKYEDDNKKILETFQLCSDEKKELEINLLAKFSALLNSKKNKIAELKALLIEKNKALDLFGGNTENLNPLSANSIDTDDYSSDDDDDEFALPTQPLTQLKQNLPKRIKLNVDADSEIASKKKKENDTEAPSTSKTNIVESTQGCIEIVNSQNLFDQM